MHDFYWASLRGGEVNGIPVKGRLMQQGLSYFYNSILSSIKTPIKAIFGTNMISVLRPFQAYAGAFIRGNQTEMAVSASMINSLGQGFREGFDMFKYNWDLGLNRKQQTYDIRFDMADDIAQWKSLGAHMEQFGTEAEKRAYNALNWSVEFNTHPWVKYSANAMGAGDALARTVIGRMEMRQRAIRKAIADGVDLDDAGAVARATEDNFRRSIFKEGADGKWVVHDKAATMAGDEAAMTRALEGWTKGFEQINQNPLLRPFFPFVRTGVNALDLTFQHTPLVYTQRKFRNILKGKNLEMYGIRPEDALQAKALIEGRIAMGTSLAGVAGVAALNGLVTGDYPYDKERRNLWKLIQIPPYSLKIGNAWVSYRNMEPFNTLLSISANLAQNADVLGEAALDEWQAKLGFMFSAVLIDKSMLSGAKDLFAVFNPESAPYQLERTVARTAGSFIPYSALLRDIGDITDSIQKESDTVLEQIIRRTAIAKQWLPPKYDILSKDRSGKEYTFSPEFNNDAGMVLNPLMRIFNAVSPIPITPVAEDDLVKKTLLKMRFDLPGVMQSYKGVQLNAKQKSRLQYYLSKGDLRYRLERVINPKNSKLRKELNAYIEGIGGKKFREIEGWKLSNERFYRTVSSIFSQSIDEAMTYVLAEDTTLQNNVSLMEARKRTARSGSFGYRREAIENLSIHGN